MNRVTRFWWVNRLEHNTGDNTPSYLQISQWQDGCLIEIVLPPKDIAELRAMLI